jgi:uncharacterized CHY-type Zn-finger protein
MIIVDDPKCLAGVGGLNITTGMIADEDILCPRWFSPGLKFYECSKWLPCFSLQNDIMNLKLN